MDDSTYLHLSIIEQGGARVTSCQLSSSNLNKAVNRNRGKGWRRVKSCVWSDDVVSQNDKKKRKKTDQKDKNKTITQAHKSWKNTNKSSNQQTKLQIWKPIWSNQITNLKSNIANRISSNLAIPEVFFNNYESNLTISLKKISINHRWIQSTKQYETLK